MKTLLSLVTEIEQSLLPFYKDLRICNQYAWWLISHLTEKSKAHLLTDNAFNLSNAQHQTLHQWIEQLTLEHMPIGYLLGSVPFNELTIKVKPPTLIPRPETEEWSYNVATILQKTPPTPLTILDLCCGTGCIGLTLAKALPHATVYATDISPAALALAQENALHNKINNVIFIQSDLFDALPLDCRFDLIVSNPPYIAPQEWSSLDTSVSRWEDKNALIADDQGLALIKKIITQAPEYIKHNEQLNLHGIAQLIIEIGHTQGLAVSLLMNQDQFENVVVKKDLQGKDRVVCARVKNNVAITKNQF